MQEIQFAQAEPWRRWFVAALCAAFSFPWHYILWVSVYTMVRDRDPPTVEVIYVLAAVACAAYLLCRWAWLLARGSRNGRKLLNNSFLWGSALLLGGLAIVSLTATPANLRAATHFSVLAGAACLLALARRTKNGA